MKPAKNSAATKGKTRIAATPAQAPPPGDILPWAEALREPPGSFDSGRFSLLVLDRPGLTGNGAGGHPEAAWDLSVLERLRHLFPGSRLIMGTRQDGRTPKVQAPPGGRPAADPVPEASPCLNPPAPPLPQGEAEYRAMVEAFDGLIYISSADYDLEFLNRRFAQRLGIEKLGQKCYRALHQQLDICPWCARDRVMQGERVYQENFRPQENRWYGCTSTPVRYGGRLSQMTIIQDITERKAVEEEIKRRAYYDQLTGLPNRSLFNDRLAMALAQARRQRQQVAVMMLDLDRFKDINDSLGHRVGDTLLKEVAVRLTGLIRESDTVARLGGDEFTLISTGISRLQDALKIARRTLKTFGSPFNCQGLEVRVTASLGIALYPDHGEDLDTLVQHADLAMYRAKNGGRRGYRCFSPGQDGNKRRLSRLNPGPTSLPF